MCATPFLCIHGGALRRVSVFCALKTLVSLKKSALPTLSLVRQNAAALQLAMIANAKRTIVVTDSNKLGKTAMYRNERKISLSS